LPNSGEKQAPLPKRIRSKTMNNLSRVLAAALMAATIPATIVLAQQAGGDQPATEKTETRRGPSPETLARLEDGRIAFAKAALKLSPDQEKLWAPVEANIRASFDQRREARAKWQEKRDERRADRQSKGDEAKGDAVKREKLALPERIEKRSQHLTDRAAKMTERAAKVKEFAETLKPLYATFSEEQKAVADKVLNHFGGEGRGKHGPRWAMGGERHGRGGRD
jgi:LTXXQ motif family protein